MGNKPRGDKAPVAEVHRRLNLMEDAYLRHGTRTETLAATDVLPGPWPDSPDLRLASSTRRRYLRAVEARWARADAENLRGHRRTDVIRLLRSVIRGAEKAGQFAAVLRGIELMAKLLGVAPPEVVEVRDERAGGIEDPDRLTVDEALLLLELKAKARGANGTAAVVAALPAPDPKAGNGASN